MKGKSLSRVRLLATPWTAPTRLLRPWDFPGKSTEWGAIAFSVEPTMGERLYEVFFSVEILSVVTQLRLTS